MEPEERLPSEAAAWHEQERFALESGRRMSLRNRLLWLEEMHELVLRWSSKRRMMYPDGTVLGPLAGELREPADPYNASTEPKGDRREAARDARKPAS
jgi:hypothetical protein